MVKNEVNSEKLDKLIQTLKNQIDVWYENKIKNNNTSEFEIGSLCDFLVKELDYPSEKIGEFLNHISLEKVDDVIRCNENSSEYTISIPKKIEEKDVEFIWILKNKHKRESELEISLYKNHSIHINCWDYGDYGGWSCTIYDYNSLDSAIYGWINDRM